MFWDITLLSLISHIDFLDGLGLFQCPRSLLVDMQFLIVCLMLLWLIVTHIHELRGVFDFS